MEITIHNKLEDNEAFYNYMVKETEQGKKINRQAILIQHLGRLLATIIIASLFWIITKNILLTLLLFVFCIALSILLFYFLAENKPQYYYGIQVYKQQEKLTTKKDWDVFLLSKKLIYNKDWLEIQNTEVSHRYRWRRIDFIGLTKENIYIHVGTCPVVYIPKRDLPSEEEFVAVGKELLELWNKFKDQPIGSESWIR